MVGKANSSGGGSQIKCRTTLGAGAQEILITYNRDNAVTLDLSIRFPVAYPLRAASAACPKHSGVQQGQVRAWLMASDINLRNSQSSLGVRSGPAAGSVAASAVETWIERVQGKFDNAEECPICYSVVHATSKALPKVACKTCRSKFHAECLYQWFKSSHKSNCPMCQTPF